ncbi:peptidoglycan glycosyltransferase [Jatrophihabitans sp. GAS493]|uniref:penicillin-binding transpeptidase domain-containing protein n=1 Tax=Jatrophihabitans sp. GAS493 TaxID=1907575 RepID=UPI000BB7DA1C|nr:penicillin-binding transpeptidase domain-containing protein [Jatrophihabitans sp. GAS493]SOD70829.1 peptidoglycan glycosyltransferase [Jatrophihabitans sp. GAS493]
MNRQIRRVAIAVGVLMAALLLNLNYVQVIKSDAYRDDSRNRRVLLTEYSTPRGQIVVQGTPVAESVRTTDELEFLRRYPLAKQYASVTGYYSLFYGKGGLEQSEDEVLSGSDPRLLGRRIADIITGREPQGGSVILTLNKAAQATAYAALAGRRGSVVAMDPVTGAILADVSSPSYDPNLLSSHNSAEIQAAWDRNVNDPNQPMLDRGLAVSYPPGSVFKVVVSAAALKAGKVPSDRIPAPTVLKLPGTESATMTNFGGEKCGNGVTDTLLNAFTISCNTAFGQLGMDLGTDAVRSEAALFGIDDQSRTVPLPVVRSTIGPVPDQAALAQTSIGQRDVQLTSLQIAMLSAAVANDGKLMTPYLVAREQAPNLSSLSVTEPKLFNTVLDSAQATMLQQMMVSVVQNGTGTKAQIKLPGVVVGGKTGTADNQDSQGHPLAPHATFTGYAIRNGTPKIAISVVLENAGVNGSESAGGLAAAPVARAVMSAYLNDPASS